MSKRRSSLRCPTCRKIVARSDPEFPFCSERCRLIDLGKWASGGYVVSTPINSADQTGEAAYATQQRSLQETKAAGKPHGDGRDTRDEHEPGRKP
jgi:hypothetical protein